jgi:hypothetical protein
MEAADSLPRGVEGAEKRHYNPREQICFFGGAENTKESISWISNPAGFAIEQWKRLIRVPRGVESAENRHYNPREQICFLGGAENTN